MIKPTYRDWELFWELHLLDDFRKRYDTCSGESCGALNTLDELRHFFDELVSDRARDAELPAAIHLCYIDAANHFIVYHAGFPTIDLDMLSAEMTERLLPVFDAIVDSMPVTLIAMIRMVRTTLNENRNN